jgi:hypothetical protein
MGRIMRSTTGVAAAVLLAGALIAPIAATISSRRLVLDLVPRALERHAPAVREQLLPAAPRAIPGRVAKADGRAPAARAPRKGGAARRTAGGVGTEPVIVTSDKADRPTLPCTGRRALDEFHRAQ